MKKFIIALLILILLLSILCLKISLTEYFYSESQSNMIKPYLSILDTVCPKDNNEKYSDTDLENADAINTLMECIKNPNNQQKLLSNAASIFGGS